MKYLRIAVIGILPTIAGCGAAPTEGAGSAWIPFLPFIINLILAFWVSKDAKKRNKSFTWAPLVLVTGIIGFIIYLFARRTKKEYHTKSTFLPNDKRAFDNRIISVSLEQSGIKEHISPDGVTNRVEFTLQTTNNSSNYIKWLTIDIIKIFSYKTTGYSKAGKYTSTHLDYQNVHVKSDTPLAPNETRKEDYYFEFDDVDANKFARLEVYQIYGELETGESFTQLRYKKIEFDSNGSNTSSKVDNCFIVTAAFGDPMDPMVQEYRFFRDNLLTKFNLGILFIRWYNINGPKAARLISRDHKLQFFCRVLLTPFAIFIRALREIILKYRLLFQQTK